MEKRFKKLTAADYVMLAAGAGWTNYTVADAERALDASLFSFAVESEGKTIGMIRCVGDGVGVFLLCDLAVLPAYRHKGYGSMLLREAVNMAKNSVSAERGMVYLVSLVSAEGFYQKNGFTRLPHANLGNTFMKIITKSAH